MIDSIAFVIFVGMIFYVIYKSVVDDDLMPRKDRRFRPAPPAHGARKGGNDDGAGDGRTGDGPAA